MSLSKQATILFATVALAGVGAAVWYYWYVVRPASEPTEVPLTLEERQAILEQVAANPNVPRTSVEEKSQYLEQIEEPEDSSTSEQKLEFLQSIETQ